MKTRVTKSILCGTLLLVSAMLCVTMAGCTKEDGDDGTSSDLQGFWSANPIYNSYDECNFRSPVYEFVNDNTAIEYINVCDTRIQGVATNRLSDHDGWYYGSKQTKTYAFSNNKVIFTNGDIYTFMNGKLYKDNSSTVLRRWKTESGNGSDDQNPQDTEMTNKLINTTWKFVKSVTYYKSSGTTKTDTNPYGTVSFRSSLDPDCSTNSNYRILAVNGKQLGAWRFKDGILNIGGGPGLDYVQLTSSQLDLLFNIVGTGGVIEQLTSSSLIIVKEYDSSTQTFYYTKN